MLLKLVFTQLTSYQAMLKSLSLIINDASCTTITAVNTLLINQGVGVGFTPNNSVNLNTTTSFIYRTATSGSGLLSTAKTKSFFQKLGGTVGYNNWIFGIEQSVYDFTSHKIINIIYNNTSSSPTTGLNVLNTITTTARSATTYSNLFDTPVYSADYSAPAVQQALQTQFSPNTSATRVVSTTPVTGTGYSASPANNQTYTTMFAFVTDNCFYVQFFTNANPTNPGKGIPIGSDIPSRSTRPIMSWQYTRSDPWNLSSNSIFPAIYNNIGTYNTTFCDSVYLSSAQNNYDSQIAWSALRAYTSINAQPSTTATSWPLIHDIPATLGIGNFYPDMSAQGQNVYGYYHFNDTYQNVSEPGGYHFGPVFASTSSNSRWYSNDINTAGYALLPLSWRNTWYFNNGGNITNRTGIYMFNGNFWPGDNITTATSKNYYLLPAPLSNNSSLLALAFPKE